jgi:hypothetical protein
VGIRRQSSWWAPVSSGDLRSLTMSELRNRAFLDGYGIAMSTSTTVVDAVVEAAAPAIEEVLTSRAAEVVRGLGRDLVLYFRERGFVPTTTLMRTGLGVLLLIKVRNYPMAAYLVVPVYLLWETIGFSIVEGLWRRFSPQLLVQAARYYEIGLVRLQRRWQRMRRAQHALGWLRRNWQLAGGTVVGTALLSWIVRRFYRWRNSPKVRFRADARKFFRAEAARRARRHGQTTSVGWLPRGWSLAWALLRIERLVPRMVDEFGCSAAISRRLLLDAVPRDSSPQLQAWFKERGGQDGSQLQLWIERGVGGHPPAKLRERDFLAITEKLRVYRSVYREDSLCTPFQLTFTLPSETLFGQGGGDPAASHADKCGAFHMRVRYGFQNETGENALSETINWRLDAEPLEESAKGNWRSSVSSTSSRRLRIRKVRRGVVSKWRRYKTGSRGINGTDATAAQGLPSSSSSSSSSSHASFEAGESSAVDEEGWFNPLVYDGGSRLSPRLKNLQVRSTICAPPPLVVKRGVVGMKECIGCARSGIVRAVPVPVPVPVPT